MDQSLPDGLGFAIPISEMRPHCEFRLDPSELGIFVDRAGKRAMVSGGTAGISPSSFAAIPWLPMLRSMIWNAFGRLSASARSGNASCLSAAATPIASTACCGESEEGKGSDRVVVSLCQARLSVRSATLDEACSRPARGGRPGGSCRQAPIRATVIR
jgi:hypothetical protein